MIKAIIEIFCQPDLAPPSFHLYYFQVRSIMFGWVEPEHELQGSEFEIDIKTIKEKFHYSKVRLIKRTFLIDTEVVCEI